MPAFSNILQQCQPLLYFLPLEMAGGVFIRIGILQSMFIIQQFLVKPDVFGFDIFSTISVMASVTVLCTSVITSLISLFAFEVHEQIVQKPVNKYMNSILSS